MKLKYKRLLMIILCIALVMPQILLPANEVVYGSSTGICTATTLNIRTGPGTTYDKVTVDGTEAYLVKNQEVTILSESNGWYQISAIFSGTTVEGYCLGTYIKVGSGNTVTASPTPTVTATATPTPEAQKVSTTSYKLSAPAVISANELNVRESASTTGKVLATLKSKASVTITGVSGSGTDTWYKVSTKVNNNTVKGYVLAKYVQCTFSKGFYGKIATSGITLKASAGAKASDSLVSGKSVPVAKGTLVWLSGEETVSGIKYFRVGFTYNGTKVRGYVAASSIKMLGDKVTTTTTVAPTATQAPSEAPSTSTESSATKELNLPAVVTASQLNLRKSASTSSTKVASLARNASVKVLSVVSTGAERWYYVSTMVNGKATKGYVHSSYIAFTFTKGFYGSVAAETVVMQTAPGSGKTNVTLSDGSEVTLTKGTRIWLSEEQTIDGAKWFRIGITLEGKATRGYTKAENITIIGTTISSGSSGSGTNTEAGTNTGTGTDTSTTIDAKEDFQIPAVVTANTLNLRKDASTSGTKLASLTKDTKLTILNEKDVNGETWYRVAVTVKGKTTVGYVLSSYVKLTLSQSVAAETASSVKLRTSAKTTAAYKKDSSGSTVALKKGTAVTITAETTVNAVKWFKITVKVNKESISGYVLASTINFSKKATVTPTKAPTATATPTPSPTPSVQSFTANGTIKDATALVVKAGPGYGSSFAQDAGGNSLVLSTGKEVKIFGSAIADDIIWYQISFEYAGTTYTGYVNENYVLIDESSINQGDSTIPDPGYVGDDDDFEAKLNNEGFPEDYKMYLRQLHAIYPNWEFVAYHTGLDWNTAIDNESTVGKNLITNTKGIGWKSLESGAYNWKTDSFIVFDGSSWVTASREAISYYMDPRNFLTEEGIFQFEHLKYQPSYQNLAGVENILRNTPLYQSSYTYSDDFGMTQYTTYGETFMSAAEYSGVSPYHLASRVKQEVVTGPTSVSNSVSGTFSGLEGLYNFYNIGAYHSTVAGGAIANGLKYAKNGSTSASLNVSSLIPWNNQYRSIVGGAYIIGSSYINKGQDTIYLQKFNVTPTSTYSHQYMANVEAPYSESKKVYSAYTDVSSSPIVFSIPVFINMPETVCAAPSSGANPNNWLKALQITDASGNDLGLTPTFDINSDQEYYLVLDSGYDMVNVLATTVSSKATVYGTGYIPLVEGQNIVTVTVTAENGDIRQYNITIVRDSQS